MKTAKSAMSALLSGLILAAAMPLAPAYEADAASMCVVNPSKTYQTIKGFGGINLP